MFKERSSRARLGGSGPGGRGGRRRAVRAACPRGTGPEPFNAIRWLQFVVFGICIFKSSDLVAVGSGNCFFQDGSGFGLNGACTNGTMVMNLGDHQELKFYMEFGYIAENKTLFQMITLGVGEISLGGDFSVNANGTKYFATGGIMYFYPIYGKVDGEGIKLKGKDDSDFIQVVKGAPNFEKTWIGYTTTVKYLGKTNLTALNFQFFDATEYDPSKDKMPVYLVVIIVVAVLVGLGVIVAAIVGVVCCCVVRRKNKKKLAAAAPGENKSTTYEGRIKEAKSRAEFLGYELPEKPKLHESFLENRGKPKSKKYSVEATAPLKSLTDKQLINTGKAWSPLMDRTQEESVPTAVEELRSREAAVEFEYPLMAEPKFKVITHLLSLPIWWQRFDLYFDMPVEVVRPLIKEAKERLIRYRNTFPEGSVLRATIDKDMEELAQVEMVADQVSAAKTGAKKYRLPYSFQTGEEFGMLFQPQQIFAACNEGINKEQLIELRRIIKEMEKRLQTMNKTVFGEKTAKDVDRIRLKSEQIDNLKFFAWLSARLLGIDMNEPRINPNAH
ncbi:hypothetical protein M3Y98_00130100 [Aphelenchoides besseyi]|nr:hypothetical protein M3Y98_00130100 [Aphelenchoides besseyi]